MCTASFSWISIQWGFTPIHYYITYSVPSFFIKIGTFYCESRTLSISTMTHSLKTWLIFYSTYSKNHKCIEIGSSIQELRCRREPDRHCRQIYNTARFALKIKKIFFYYNEITTTYYIIQLAVPIRVYFNKKVVVQFAVIK